MQYLIIATSFLTESLLAKTPGNAGENDIDATILEEKGFKMKKAPAFFTGAFSRKTLKTFKLKYANLRCAHHG